MEEITRTTPPKTEGNKASGDRGELIVVVPFFLFCLCILLGSLQYRIEASLVPIMSGSVGLILSGMRILYLLFPQWGIGAFKQGGLAQEFDDIKDDIKEERHLKKDEDEADTITFAAEKKAFLYLIACFAAFVLLGYLAGIFCAIMGCSYYYHYRDKWPIIISLASLYLIVYVLLNKLLEAPAYYGLLLEPVLRYYRII